MQENKSVFFQKCVYFFLSMRVRMRGIGCEGSNLAVSSTKVTSSVPKCQRFAQ